VKILDSKKKIIGIELILIILSIVALVSATTGDNTTILNPGDNIQTAIDNANPGDIIQLNGGVYNQYNIYVNKQVTIKASTTNETPIIDAQGKGRVFINEKGVLEGLTVTGGKARIHGGGVYNDNEGIMINCSIKNNFASTGGGVYNNGIVRGCNIEGNTATTWGGVYNNGVMAGCNISDNIASNGGVYNAGDLNGCIITGNNVNSKGGGVYNTGNLSYCTITGNIAKYGAGIFNYNGTVIGCTIEWNIANSIGGGVYTYYGIVKDCNIINNIACDSDGGLYSIGAIVSGCNFRNNTPKNKFDLY
jgi:hypothetical protein